MDLKKWVSKLGIIFLTVFSCSISRANSNLLPNPSFETAGTGVTALNWTTYQCGYSRSNDIACEDGTWACKITGTGAGLGGTCSTIFTGLPASGTFTISSNVNITSYTQGLIYGAYVTVRYADSSQKIFQTTLSAAEITANMNVWKNYSLTFSTDPNKTIASICVWCLVWTDNGNKFIGTIYFDNVRLAVFEPVVYWPGNNIYKSTDKDLAAANQRAADVLARGFTHVCIASDDSNRDVVRLLSGKGFQVIKLLSSSSAPRHFSPYTLKTNYDAAKATLANYLALNPEVTGIADDIEAPPFPRKTYPVAGVPSPTPSPSPSPTPSPDLDQRIGNVPSVTDFPIFKDWPNAGDHNVLGLTMENIEYNFPKILIDRKETPTDSGIIGYFAPGFTYQSYEMIAQTFKPVDTNITRIDVMIKRTGSNQNFPLGDLYYYLTQVDANGKPDLTKKISYPKCTITSNEINMNSASWVGIDALALYFDPVLVGALDTSKTYALVLEFTKKDSNNWNNAYYNVAGFKADIYSNGSSWRRANGSWIADATSDLWFKIYAPAPPGGFALNKFHEDWIDFQCAVCAKFVQDYREIADEAAPRRKVWIYSGYEGANYAKNLHDYDGMNRRAYSVDWKVIAKAGVDYAVCGYGTIDITATITALSQGIPSNPSKLIGGGYTPYGEASFIDRYNTCAGAMLYYSGSYDDDPGWSVP